VIPEDVAWCLRTLARRRAEYDMYWGYYQGRHKLAFVTERMQDAFGSVFREYSLNVVGFSAPGASSEGTAPAVQALWERGHLPYRQGQVHRMALAMGDAYLLVWQDDAGIARVYDEDPRQVVGHPDPDVPGDLDYAAKVWVQGKRVRLTMYYADRIERYITVNDGTDLPDAAKVATLLRPLRPGDVPEGEDARDLLPNPWQAVPVVHLAHRPGPNGLGQSVLRDVKGPQDALNKTVADILAGGEVQALPWRFLIGYQPETRPDGTKVPLFNERRDRVVHLPKGADVKQLDGMDPAPLLAVKDSFAADVADVSGVPRHALQGVRGADWPSGEALRVAESRQVAHDTNLTLAWGPQWARTMALNLRMAQGGTTEVRTLWAPVGTPPSDVEAATAAEAKQRAGIPREQTWREMGYSEQQIAECSAAYAAEAEREAERQARAFDVGSPLATGGV
jgi:hypothetical protein